MNRRTALYLTLALVAIAIGVATYFARRTTTVSTVATQTPHPVAAKIAVGKPAPQFTALTTAGLFDLARSKKPVFLEVFATWCPHCQRETAAINELYAADKANVAFVAVSGSETGMDGQSPETANDVLTFAQKFHVKYPIAYDGAKTVANLYLQDGFPTIVIINRAKKISYIGSGEIPTDELNAALQKVI
ncbi:MAG: TlpA family protein disulfide reductase [Candidatus Eremiobacteraeota bacterium]|nr:TlpA family protein disulfide reductase [Candidatus Eremiobacteraeota bacterium]